MRTTDRKRTGANGEDESRFPSRRDVVTLGIGAFLVASVPLARRRSRRTLVRRQIPAMGTVAEVSILHEDDEYAQRAIDAALSEIRHTEGLLTRFRLNSDVGRANQAVPGRAVRIEDETGQVLETALALARSSDGKFDPCLGDAVALWDVGRRSSPPASESVTGFAGRGLYRALEVDRGNAGTTVRMHEPNMSIDLGGIGKGWGVDRAVQALRDWGIRDGLVNLGGDLYALGNSDDGDPWRVGIRDPDAERGVVAEIPLSDAALATSGDYEQFFTHLGRRYHHILDPKTGEPVLTVLRSITVAHDRCTVADACATALFSVALDRTDGALARTVEGARLVHTVTQAKAGMANTHNSGTE